MESSKVESMDMVKFWGAATLAVGMSCFGFLFESRLTWTLKWNCVVVVERMLIAETCYTE